MMNYETNTNDNATKESDIMPVTKANSKTKIVAINQLIKDTIAAGDRDSWFKLFEAFRGKIAQDQKVLSKHEVDGRAILYKQLANAYRIGLQLVNEVDLAKPSNSYNALFHLMYRHSLESGLETLKVVRGNIDDRLWNEENPKATQRPLKAEVSLWVYITKLLYGQWFETKVMTDIEEQAYSQKIGAVSQGKGGALKRHFNLGEYAPVLDAPDEAPTVYQVWKPNRSAEKYAVVFRHLHNLGIAADDVPAFIEGFTYTDQKKTKSGRLIGLERAGRAAANQGIQPKPESQAVIEKRAAYVERAEDTSNEKVFSIPKPMSWPSKVHFARAVLKVVGNQMLIVGFEEMDAGQYVNHAVKIGKPLLDEENGKAADKDKAVEATLQRGGKGLGGSVLERTYAALLVDGADQSALNDRMAEFLEAERKQLAFTKPVEGLVTPDAT